MTTRRTLQLALAALAAVSGGGCAILGPTCLARQQRGTVTTISGQVDAGEIVSHQVRYAVEGSQNSSTIEWSEYRSSDPPRVQFHATRVGCADFQAPPATNSGDCQVLGSAGWTQIGPVTNLTVTHGRGNPEVLDTDPQYKIWVIGDAERSVRYTINITWFYGPDC